MRFAAVFFLAGAIAAQTYSAKESALGKALAADATRSLTVISDPELQRYVDALAKRLSPADWHIAVVQDEIGGSTHEPAAFPGGYLFIPTRLIVESRSEAEFAGMLAHAMAHVLNRDAVRTPASQGSAIPVVFVGGIERNGMNAIPQGLLPRERQFELDADTRAVELLTQAQLPLAALTDYLARTQGADSTRSRLPLKAERLRALDQAVQSAPAVAIAPSSPEFERLRAALIPPPHPAPSLQRN